MRHSEQVGKRDGRVPKYSLTALEWESKENKKNTNRVVAAFVLARFVRHVNLRSLTIPYALFLGNSLAAMPAAAFGNVQSIAKDETELIAQQLVSA